MSQASGFVAGLLVVVLVVPAPLLALTKKVSLDGGEITVVDTREYPIIFVHGAAGSELNKGGENLWPGAIGGVINDSSAAQMALNSNGKTDCCGTVTATKVMRYGGGAEIGFLDAQFAPVYQGFYDYMDAQGFGYEEQEDGKVFYDFVYDWRKDNRQATKALEIKVNAVLKETKAEKVILVGHSMGGIQIRLYMNDAKRAKKVGGVIFLATPHHGAPQVYWAYTYGYNFGNTKVSDTRMWEVMKNWPAGYQLLPDYPAVQDGETGKFWTVEQALARTFYSEQEYQHVLSSSTGREQKYFPTPGLPNTQFALDALDFHRNVLGDSVKKYPDVKYYMVAGTGQPTVQYFTANLVTRPGFDLPILQLEKVKTNNGDGTVPAAGAKIEGVDEFVTVIGEHGAIPSTPAAQAYVTKYRESLNDEKARTMLADQAAKLARQKLPQAAQMRSAGLGSGESPADKDENIAAILFRMFFFGVPDEEKIKARDDLKRNIARAVENININVEITGNAERKDDAVYLAIRDFKVVDHGTGKISPADMIVQVPSYEVFDGLVSGTIDIESAWKSGQIVVKGGSFIEAVKMKILSWWMKYGAK